MEKNELSREYYEYLHTQLQNTIVFADECHTSVNHKYGKDDSLPYYFHLKMANKFALKYLYLIPKENHIDVLKAVWCHDTIEDTRRSYNYIEKKLGQSAADMVFAVTNEKGKNRREKANAKYYKEMVQVPFAVFVKLCDKLANASYSKSTESSMFQMYKEEFPYFRKMTFNNTYADMYNELNEILGLYQIKY